MICDLVFEKKFRARLLVTFEIYFILNSIEGKLDLLKRTCEKRKLNSDLSVATYKLLLLNRKFVFI